MDIAELRSEQARLEERYGLWTTNIELPGGNCTFGRASLPDTRLKRIVQIIADLVGKPLSSCRILDLGCLEGMFSLELARHGALAVGVEVREANIEKARFLKRAYDLANLEFHQDDVRNVSLARYGSFDAIICSGILYHLLADDAIRLIRSLHEMTRLAVIDTHVALTPAEEYVHEGRSHWGRQFREHQEGSSEEEREKSVWASADNLTSFWFTRPSLVNILSDAGFSSTYECFTPVHMDGLDWSKAADRCTFVAIKGEAAEISSSPGANDLKTQWPEQSLSYAAPVSLKHMILNRLFGH